ncbi:response regulator transcription factor [Dyella sp.]|uniref:response regulator transcription factor n=1 Tax=Dyella sp. TaxID=1869338 RepID=UPI002ED0B319
MNAFRVLLADDHALLREGIHALIARNASFEVIAHAADGRDCVRLALRENPDLVIFDHSMPGLNGVEAARRIAARSTRTRLLCLSMHEEPARVHAAFDAGAHGYVLKRCAFGELIEGMETVMKGRHYASRDIAHLLAERNQIRAAAPEAPLSSREREIAQLFAEGYATRDIAERLCVSVKTVGTHREHIMAKLGIHGIADLTRYALREGLTSLEG